MLSLPLTSSSISRKKYDVFLSFRGEDTRKNFTGHLYEALKSSGIVTFRDDPKLEAGEEIAPELCKAIQQSWCSVIIFSKTYAFSGWCLEELAEIVQQKNANGHKVFPIFYDVDPSDLRNQKEKVEEAFAKHEERYKEDKDKIQKWRNALAELLFQILPNECFNFFNVHEGNAIISRRLSSEKVLVVLDDVDNLQHLKYLVGRRDWFSLGSRIIVTTRDEHLLRSYRIDDVYKPTTLNPNDALRLFNLKAFDGDTMSKYDFIELSEHVRYAGGLPLALEVLGSFLCGKDIVQWRRKKRRIYLDIACFFNGEKKDLVMKVLHGYEFFPDIGIDILIKKSLIKVSDDNQYLRIHALLQEMERKIVEEKCVGEPGKRCRLWKERDVHHVLTKNTLIFVLFMVIRESSKMLNLSADTFSKMKNLRLLKVLCLSNCDYLKYLSNELRLLDWTGYPLRYLPSSFQPNNLVALLLPYSHIKQLWKGNKFLYKLKIMNLKGSQNLIKTLDFTTASNLEILILEGCTKLVDVYPSIGVLKSLKLLNLRDCKSLRTLPTKIEMESLETLILSGCSSLVRFLEIDGKMKRLKTLDLSGCYRVENLSENLQQSKDCNLCEGDIPRDISGLSSLKHLDLSGNNFISIPASLTGLSKVGFLELSNCNICTLGEGDIPRDISGLSSLVHLGLSGNSFISMPASLTRLSKLQFLGLSYCKMLKSLPKIPRRVGQVWIDGCSSLEVLCNLVGSGAFRAINCFKLAENMNALTLLKKELKAFANSRKMFDIMMPGSEIPEWFSNQESGSLIMIPYIYCRNSEQASCNRSIFRGRNDRRIDWSGWGLREPIMKDHLFLRYWSRDKLYPSSENKYNDCETTNLWATHCLDKKCDELNVSFSERGKCGFRIVYEKDLEVIKELQ
ncbi:hypothetical protein GOBAR_DD29653 [Gossypium barbadense]|nr:hypothetical protein GOBAR_DD29653 [Gossypium barbadense]